jgi:hypothetical protein
MALVMWGVYRFGIVAALIFGGAEPHVFEPAIVTEALLQRYNSLNIEVPAETILGYAGSPDAGPMQQMVARYALTPVLLDATDARRLVLVDFESDAAMAEYVAKVQGVVRVHHRPGLAIVERPDITR